MPSPTKRTNSVAPTCWFWNQLFGGFRALSKACSAQPPANRTFKTWDSPEVQNWLCWAKAHARALVPDRGEPITNTGLGQTWTVAKQVGNVWVITGPSGRRSFPSRAPRLRGPLRPGQLINHATFVLADASV